MYLINAHGPDHGLSVEVVYGDVIVRQWGERDEPDEHGSHMPHIQTARIALENLLDKNLPHYACGNVSRGSMHEKIIDLALKRPLWTADGIDIGAVMPLTPEGHVTEDAKAAVRRAGEALGIALDVNDLWENAALRLRDLRAKGVKS